MQRDLRMMLLLVLWLGSGALACGDGAGANGGAVSLRLALTSDDRQDGRAPGVIAASDAQGSAIAVDDAVAWVRDIELDLPDGTLRIDEDEAHCSDIENVLKDAIKESGDLR